MHDHHIILINHHLVGWFLLAIHAALVVRVLSVRGKEPAARAAWILAIVFLPVLGIIAYIFLGEPRLSKRLKKADDWARNLIAERSQNGPVAKSIGVPYRAAFDLCGAINGFEASDGHEARLAADSNAAISAIVDDIEAATQTVHISFYIWLDDHNGTKVVEALKRASERGVICRVIVDAIGSRAFIKSSKWSELKASGVRLVEALPPPRGLGMVWGNRIDVRNHRKIVIIDNRITHFGSQNCADPEFLVKARFAPWVDIMLRLTGPVVAQNQILFVTDWMTETGEDVSAICRESVSKVEKTGLVAVGFGTGPLSLPGTMSNAFTATIYAATRELVVSTPYFVPDQALRAALSASARRGVETILIVPARNDSRVVGVISRGCYSALLESGVRIFEFNGGLLHAKTMVADSALCLIGSANMDRRSLELNFENNVLLRSTKLGAEIRERQAQYLSNSSEVFAADIASQSLGKRIVDNAIAMFSPVF